MEDKEETEIEGQHSTDTNQVANPEANNVPSENLDNVQSGQDGAAPVSEVPDGGYGWVVVIASFISLFIISMTFNGFGILYIEWRKYFQRDSGSIGWLGSVYPFCGNLFSVLFASLVEIHGCRIVSMLGGALVALAFFISSFVNSVSVLYFTYGILGGFGLGAVILSSFVIVHQYFDKRRALAASISVTSFSFAELAAGPFYQYLVNVYGWRGTLLIMSGVCLHILAAGLLYMPLKPHITNIPQDQDTSCMKKFVKLAISKLKDPSLFKEPCYILLSVGSFLWAMGVTPFIFHTPSRALVYGVDQLKASFLFTCYGIATLCSRPFFGFIANIKGNNRVVQTAVALLFTGVLIVLNTLAVTYEYMVVFCVLVGIGIGAFNCISSTIIVDLVGMKRYSAAQGYNLVILGLGTLAGIPLAGYLYDFSQDYSVPFYAMGAFVISAGAIFAIIPAMQWFLLRKQQQTDGE